MPQKIKIPLDASAVWFDWNDMVEAEFEDPPWLVKDILPSRSRMLLFGDTEVGKSLYALTLATCVLQGGVFLRKFPCRQGNVVYVSTTDMALSEWQPRYRQAHPLCLPARERFLHVQLFENPDIVRAVNHHEAPEWVAAARSYAPALVVVDIVEDTHLLNSNEDQTPGRVYAAWQRAIPGAAFVFVHHERKQPAPTPGDKFPRHDNPYQSFSGNHRWLGLVSGGIRAWKQKPSGPMGIEIVKARNIHLEADIKISTHMDPDTLLMDIGDDLWRRVWEVVEAGASPEEAVLRLSDPKHVESQVRKMAEKIKEILEWREKNVTETSVSVRERGEDFP